MKKKQTKYCVTQHYKYKDGIFSAGLVKNSIHKVNIVFIRINDWVFDLRKDEAFAIISSLSDALWAQYQLCPPKKLNKKLKWVTSKQMFKKEE